jgi:hypothetical protein
VARAAPGATSLDDFFRKIVPELGEEFLEAIFDPNDGEFGFVWFWIIAGTCILWLIYLCCEEDEDA